MLTLTLFHLLYYIKYSVEAKVKSKVSFVNFVSFRFFQRRLWNLLILWKVPTSSSTSKMCLSSLAANHITSHHIHSSQICHVFW